MRDALLRGGLAALLLLARAGAAAPRALTIEDFAASVEVARSGIVTVTETITARFDGTWNGLYRSIPVEYRTPRGLAFHLRLEPVSATDEREQALRWDSSRERHYRKIKIWVPGAIDATRTIVLRYRVRNAIRFLDDHDELYWNVTGDEWDVPIARATARITLPWGVQGVRATAFTGAYGSRQRDAEVATEEREVAVRMRRPLAFHEGLTIAVGWSKGIVAPPGGLALAADFLRANWPLAAPLVAFVLMGSLWRRRGRDPELRSIAVRYQPPEGLSPAEVGTLTDDRVDGRDITATLVDLAVRGLLTIEEKETSRWLGLGKHADYTLHRRTPLARPADLKAHEWALLSGVFSGRGESVPLSELENDFYRHLSTIRDSVFNALGERGFYGERPDRVRKRWMVAAAVPAVLGVAGAIVGGPEPLGTAPLTLALGGLGTALAIGAFGWFMPRRTVAGTRALEDIQGFEEFLARVEAGPLERAPKTPELFEKYLPFAMALGVERQWARAFEDICREPPRWYQGANVADFRTRGFVDHLGAMSHSAAAAMVSQPRSTGSGSAFGGGSGGGSSGGGFGGGGGGGF